MSHGESNVNRPKGRQVASKSCLRAIKVRSGTSMRGRATCYACKITSICPSGVHILLNHSQSVSSSHVCSSPFGSRSQTTFGSVAMPMMMLHTSPIGWTSPVGFPS